MKPWKREILRLEREAKFAMLYGFGFWFFALLFWEVLLHAVVFGEFSIKFGYVVGFSGVCAGVLAIMLSFVPQKAHFWTALGVTVLGVIAYGSQMVYNYVFGTMYSMALMDQGGAAMTSFWRETLATIVEHILVLLLLFVPTVVLVLLRKKKMAPSNLRWRGIALLVAIVLYVATTLAIGAGGTGAFSDSYFYSGKTIATQQVAERFGMLTMVRLELFGGGSAEEEEEQVSYYVPPVETQPPVENQEEAEVVEEEIKYNVLPIDFDALNGLTEDAKEQALNAYFNALPGTNQNEYTGMLSDYNLIVLCGESFSRAAIHPEVTPTLYKLANEGILFQNYYNTFPNTTTDGEYALCQGLYPDSSRGKDSSSMYASRNSYLPFTLGNIFREQREVETFGYHNYKGDYYGRNESHPNMGYSMKFAKEGMKFTSSWPASDLEMMEQSVDDYITLPQFHAYYMTFSGHYRYDTNTNVMAARNWDAVKHLPYSDVCKAYLSCNVELDKAMEYLMTRLEEQGVLEKTAIVLAGDHFPYGLSDAQYSELVGYDIDKFSKFHDTLIFWVGGLEENIVVEEYCSNVDILPTILNLWGFEYDSRLLSGADVFSDGTHMAVLVDRSFLTDKVWFDANKGKATYLVEESEVPENYVEQMNQLVATRFSLASDILNTAYFNFVFEMGDVKVGRAAWG